MGEYIKIAVSSIKSNKLRSLLTMLGIIIGISSMIVITTIGNTAKNSTKNAFNNMGMNYFIIGMSTKDNPDRKEKPYKSESDMITNIMLNELVDKYPDILSFTNSEYYSEGRVITESGNFLNLTLSGITKGYQPMHKMKLSSGRFITERDNREKKHTALISESFEKKYFGTDEGVGKSIVISCDSGEEFEVTVVGVYTESNNNSTAANEEIFKIYIPYDTVLEMKNIPIRYSESAIVIWNTNVDISEANDMVKDYFKDVYAQNENWEVYVDNQQEYVETINSTMNLLTAAFSVIAAISLIVGGIGVMNIMLVSIVERTREIGVRKALGAQNSAIRIQFVTEAVMLCFIGGIIGITLGTIIGLIAGIVIKSLFSSLFATGIGSISLFPPLKSVVTSLLVSTLIGVIFGYYPANRAAKMNPIDALRYE